MKTKNYADVIKAELDADPVLKKNVENIRNAEKTKFARNAKKYLKVIKYKDWHSYDLLNGVELLEGEDVAIQWPNGKIEHKKVHAETNSEVVSDMGTPYTTTDKSTYITTSHKGQKIKVYLAGTSIKCKRLKKVKGYE